MRPDWCVLAPILLVSCLRSAWAITPDEAVPLCRAADLDISYLFVNEPPSEMVAVNLRNLSQHPCALASGAAVSFGDARHGHSIWTESAQKREEPVTVAVGESAHFFIDWETQPAGATDRCQEGGTLLSYINGDSEHSFDIWAGSLLGDVCSVVHTDAYFPGAFVYASKYYPHEAALANEPATIELKASGDTLYASGFASDSFWLYADILDRGEVLPLDKQSCPTLFLRTRAADGIAIFSEIHGNCRLARAGQPPVRSIHFEMSTMGMMALMKPGETQLELRALVGAPHAPQVEMIRSNAVTLRIAAPSSVRRNWGPDTKGLAISLVLDKETYAVGEDVPLRVAIANLSADARIASGELPCSAGVEFEVFDSSGHLVQSPGMSMCMGHGWTEEYPKGKVAPVLGLTLRGEGHLPAGPGAYTVIATWNAQATETGEPLNDFSRGFGSGPRLLPYAVVRSVVVSFAVAAQAQ